MYEHSTFGVEPRENRVEESGTVGKLDTTLKPLFLPRLMTINKHCHCTPHVEDHGAFG